MRRTAFLIACGVLCALAPATMQSRDTDTLSPDTGECSRLSRKADGFMSHGEWANANAMYTLLIDRCGETAANYGGFVVSASLAGDTTLAVDMMARALDSQMPVDSLFNAVETTSFATGHADLYRDILTLTAKRYTWLSRIVDKKLLSYYIFRKDGERIIKYARTMLAGLPDSVYYLRLLAQGQMLSGNTTEALEVWLRIIDIDPENYQTLLDLGNYYMVIGDKSRATPWLAKAYSLRPTPYVASLLDLDKKK